MGASTRVGLTFYKRSCAIVVAIGIFYCSPGDCGSGFRGSVALAGQPHSARPAPAPEAQTASEASQAPSTAAEQGRAQAQEGPGQAQANMEGLSVDPELSKKPLNRVQVLGWTSLLSGLALGAGASALLNGAQTAEGSAQRILRRFDQDAGAHPIYREVQAEYDGQLKKAGAMRSTALALTVTAGVAFLTGVTLAIMGAIKKKEPKQARISGLRLRF